MKNLVVILAFALSLSACGDSKSTGANTTASEAKPAALWKYSQDSDKMSNTVSYFALCNSTNSVDFKFPYQGGSTLSIVLRNKEKNNEVMIGISKGQFIADIMDNHPIRIKFDDDKPSTYTYNMPVDGKSDLLFINNAQGFIAKLKKAKKVIIEPQFFDHGTEQFTFDVSGLEWSH